MWLAKDKALQKKRLVNVEIEVIWNKQRENYFKWTDKQKYKYLIYNCV